MIGIERRAGGFVVRYGGRVILRHSPQRPCLTISSGHTDYAMFHGNFRIRSHTRQRITCRHATIGAPNGRPHSTPHNTPHNRPHSAPDSGPRARRAHPDTAVEINFGDFARILITEEQKRKSGPDREERSLHLSLRVKRPEFNQVWLAVERPAGETVWGCGEQFSHLELSGRRVPIWVSEQGVGRGHDAITLWANIHSRSGGAWHTTYFPQPGFITGAGASWLIAADSYGELDFRPRQRAILHFQQGELDIDVAVSESPAAAIRRLASLLGRQPPLPDWCWKGIWLGLQGGRQITEQKLQNAQAAGIPVGALWVQDWVGKRETAFGRQLMWNWEADEERYPDLKGYIGDLRERTIRFLGYINPFLAPEGRLYREASRRGYCVQHPEGGDYLITVTTFPAALLDLTNPQAMSWISDIIGRNMIGIGMAGWMADYGEYLPTDARLASGEPATRLHNRYPALWARANANALHAADAFGEIVFFMRAGFSGAQAHTPAYWAGDQLANWSRHDGLPSALTAAISAGFNGIAAHHSDIGGYTSLAWVRRRRELFQRWVELAALSPIMRTHEGNRPDSNWQFDSDRQTMRHLARMSRLFCALAPYHRALQQEYAAGGLPPIRHPTIHWPHLPVGHTRFHQGRSQLPSHRSGLRRWSGSYLYGRDLFVAPVLRPRRRHWSVLLPDDHWVHLWSGKEYGAGQYRLAAPIGQPPIFYRAESDFRDLFRHLSRELPDS